MWGSVLHSYEASSYNAARSVKLRFQFQKRRRREKAARLGDAWWLMLHLLRTKNKLLQNSRAIILLSNRVAPNLRPELQPGGSIAAARGESTIHV